MPVTYTELPQEDLDRLQPLWEKLRDHHTALAGAFRAQLEGRTWAERRRELLEKSRGGGLYLDIARDGDATVGYCITTLDAGKQAELESIYIEEAWRRHGIGTAFMQRALAWMDARGAERRRIGIAAGNEGAIAFYRRFGFEPRTVIMEQVRGEA